MKQVALNVLSAAAGSQSVQPSNHSDYLVGIIPILFASQTSQFMDSVQEKVDFEDLLARTIMKEALFHKKVLFMDSKYKLAINQPTIFDNNFLLEHPNSLPHFFFFRAVLRTLTKSQTFSVK